MQQQSMEKPCPYLRSISGAIYSALPQKEWVTSQSSFLESPKSASLMWPSLSMITFQGFRSLYTIPFQWRALRAESTYKKQNLASSSFILFSFLSRLKSSPPAQYSMPRQICLDVQKQQWILVTKGCLLSAMRICFSLRTMTSLPFCSRSFLGMTLRAMQTPQISTKKTLENPPAPMHFTILMLTRGLFLKGNILMGLTFSASLFVFKVEMSSLGNARRQSTAMEFPLKTVFLSSIPLLNSQTRSAVVLAALCLYSTVVVPAAVYRSIVRVKVFLEASFVTPNSR